RKVAHKTDRVSEGIDAAIGSRVPAHRGIKGRKQRVLDQRASPRDAIEQRGLTRVGLARDCDRWNLIAASVGSFRLARGSESLDLLPQFRHPRVNVTAVEFDLGLSGATATHAGSRATDLSPGLAGHRFTPTA